jgi:hypothetical protein
MDSTFSKWLWTELLAFDIEQPDIGVGEYIDELGFTPDAISILISTVDFVLLHEPLDVERDLFADICSRHGHSGNERRKRQQWTNYHLRTLIEKLHERGVKVLFSTFTGLLDNKHHKEWHYDHPEAMQHVYKNGRATASSAVAQLADGTLYEDIFIPRLARVIQDYGFDGWQGADGWGPLSGPIFFGDISDGVMQQFVAWTDIDLPADICAPAGEDAAKLDHRIEWLWRHARRQWIDFYVDRWAQFWTKVCDTLHAIDKIAVINSSWTRDPFEARYRYGVDYRRIAATGVDGMIVETCAGSIGLGSGDKDRHDEYLAMFLLIGACIPDVKLRFLHTIKDVVEHWDLMRHLPTVLEKDVHMLMTAAHIHGDGTLRRMAGGFLGCLADGITRDEWAWLGERWDLGLSSQSAKPLGATLIWSDAAFDGEIDRYIADRHMITHRVFEHLLHRGAPIQQTARIESLAMVSGPVVMVHPTDSDREQLTQYQGGEVIIIDDEALQYGEAFDDVMSIEDPRGFRDALAMRQVANETLGALAQRITQAAQWPKVTAAQNYTISDLSVSVVLTMAELADGARRVSIRNHSHVYAEPSVDMGAAIESVTVRTSFPAGTVHVEGSTFRLRVPPRGVTVVDVRV